MRGMSVERVGSRFGDCAGQERWPWPHLHSSPPTTLTALPLPVSPLACRLGGLSSRPFSSAADDRLLTSTCHSSAYDSDRPGLDGAHTPGPMLPTPVCMRAGFWKRSLNEFKRLGGIALRLEGLKVPTKPYHLIQFANPASLSECKTMSDTSIGGYSTASLDYHPGTATSPSHARFHGKISIDLPADNPEIVRSGYAAFRTHSPGRTIFGRSIFDIDPYAFLALRVKSDGRAYFVNVQTESLVPSDIHQHRLYVRTPGEWETVYIKFNEFVRTNHGKVVEPQTEMLTQKVRTVGLGLIDRVTGPFELCIAGMWATNVLDRPSKDQAPKEEKPEPEKIMI